MVTGGEQEIKRPTNSRTNGNFIADFLFRLTQTVYTIFPRVTSGRILNYVLLPLRFDQFVRVTSSPAAPNAAAIRYIRK